MRNKDVEQKIRNAVERATPDALDGILARCGGERGGLYYIEPGAGRARNGARRGIRAAALLAAAFALTFGVSLASRWFSATRVDALVTLDVNPSVGLKINRDDRVLSVDANNADAVIILDNMDLRNTPVDVAINALIGSMLKYGYVHENANSVLLSVESVNGEKSAALQHDLTQSITLQLNPVNGAVISQNLTNDDETQALADGHDISFGKAALIQKILNDNSHLLFDDLAKLSVNELNLLMSSKHIVAEGMESHGNASDVGYIGEAGAIKTALEHAGIAGEGDTDRMRVELDYDDGGMVYDVEFYYGGVEYEYEINAMDGAILEYERSEDRKRPRDGAQTQDTAQGAAQGAAHERTESERTQDTGAQLEQSQDGGQARQYQSADGQAQPERTEQGQSQQRRDDFIGEARAREAVEAHSGIRPPDGAKVDLDKDDGIYIYEVEFKMDGKEYDYEVDAVSGDIISWEADD